MKVVLEFSHCEYRTIVVDASGQQTVLPVIFTNQGVLSQFVLYIHLFRRRSRSWQDAATFSIRLLLEFSAVNHHNYEEPRALFRAFADALFIGTIRNKIDASDLWWYPRSRGNAESIIGHITQYTDWLSSTNEEINLQLNPWRNSTRHEERLNWAAFEHRRHNAFLSHLWRENRTAGKSRAVRNVPLATDRITPAKAFPDDKFETLRLEGFRMAGRKAIHASSIRNTLITYLMHFGGLRLSEALSLWSEDVGIELGEIIVRVHHPEIGMSPDRTRRSEYLDRTYGLQPRNRLVKAVDPLFLGWKNGLITDAHRGCFEVFFYPYAKAAEFAEMWRDYHLGGRVNPRRGEDHPYAFTNMYGQPYSHRMFRKAHRSAIERLGLVYDKIHGTTPHGHRHAYGQRLAKAGAAPMQIKNAMHHASIASAETYTQPSGMEMRNSLRELETKMRAT